MANSLKITTNSDSIGVQINNGIVQLIPNDSVGLSALNMSIIDDNRIAVLSNVFCLNTDTFITDGTTRSGTVQQITGFISDIFNSATGSGPVSYNDLTDKPSIPTPPEIAATKSAVSNSTAVRFVIVNADETNNGNKSMYFHNGTTLDFQYTIA